MQKITIISLILSITIFADDSLQKEIKNIETEMKQIKTLKADFTQIKKMAIFEQELIIKGKMIMQQPDLFLWKVTTPIKYSLKVDNKTFQQWNEDDNKIQKFNLTTNPIFKSIWTQMHSWFSGNYKQLTTNYNIKLTNKTPLTITFTPKENSPTHEIIKEITITFRKDKRYIQKITINETSGDTVTITFTNIEFNQPLTNNDKTLKQK